MKRRSKKLTALFLGLMMTITAPLSVMGETTVETGAVQNEEKDSLPSYAKAVMNLSFDQAKEFKEGENTAFSTYGLCAALSVLANGVSTSSPNHQKLLSLLGAKSLEELNAQNQAFLSKTDYGCENTFRSIDLLLVDKSVAGKEGIKSAFMTRVSENYPITARTADFQNNLAKEKQLIREAVSEATNGFLPDYESIADEETKVDLMNITYFKGKWMYPFEKKDTKQKKYTNFKGKTKKVPMMRKTFDEQIRYYEDKHFRGIILPYSAKTEAGTFSQNRAEMYVILPKKKTSTKGVKQWNQKSAAYKRRFLKKLRNARTYNIVNLSLPSFETEVTLSLEDLMEKEDLGGLFGSNAGINEIVEQPLCVSAISQRTKIKVDEEGTEAAAVTEIAAKCTAILNPPKKPVYNFCCKVPFVYMICDTNGMPIFSGSVSDL